MCPRINHAIRDSLPTAVQYLFTITTQNNDTISNLIKTTHSFNYNELPQAYLLEGAVYNVEISTRRNLILDFSDPGQKCSIGLRGRTTTLAPFDCGLTYNYLIQDTLHALPIEGAQAYKYRIFDGVNFIEDTVSNSTSSTGINLIKFTGIKYCTSYLIDVRVLVSGIWGPYGEACQIITVCNPLTVLRPSFCDATVSSCGTNSYARSILYAEGYQFYISGGNINEIVTSTSNAGFKLQNLVGVANLTYETSYIIKCRVLVNGVWGAWGDGCSIYLQTNSTLTTYCNQTIPAIGVNVMSSSVGCASDYRFRINGPNVSNLIVNSPILSNCFRFSQVNEAQFNSTYQVEVSVLVGGLWSQFGTACSINTPSTLSMIESNEETMIVENAKEEVANQNSVDLLTAQNVDFSNLVSVYPHPTSDIFTLSFNNSSDKNTELTIFDNSGKLIENMLVNLTNTSSLNIGENYPNGSYHILIKYSNYTITKKLIKLSNL